MSSNTPAGVPSQPRNNRPDYWRNQLNTLAGQCHLSYKCEVPPRDEEGMWWAFYYLENPDGSRGAFLGSDSGTEKRIAREWAARKAFQQLSTLVNTWTQTALANAAASTSMATAAHSSPPVYPPGHWAQKIENLATERNLTVVCESQSSQSVTYYLVYPGDVKYLLGSNSGTTVEIAKEDAAKQAFGSLFNLIDSWGRAGTSSSGAGGSGS